MQQYYTTPENTHFILPNEKYHCTYSWSQSKCSLITLTIKFHIFLPNNNSTKFNVHQTFVRRLEENINIDLNLPTCKVVEGNNCTCKLYDILTVIRRRKGKTALLAG